MHNMHTRLRLPACVPVSLSLSLSLVVWLKTPFPSALGKGVFSPTGSPGRRAAHLKRWQGNFPERGRTITRQQTRGPAVSRGRARTYPLCCARATSASCSR